jgi:tetratricopeptide (TPR) repeat protein
MGHEMSSHDWYRCTEWNEEIAERFEVRLKRATQKAQYLRIQACMLARSHPEVALRLLDRYFELGEAFDHAQAYVDRATAYRSLGQLDSAVTSYEQALRREAEFPNVRTQAYLELPLLIATTPLPDRFEQALSILDQSEDRPTFPVEVFSWNAAYALILLARSQRSDASPYAQAALNTAVAEKSGLQHHQALGLVGDRYPELIQELGRIAHAEEGC